MKTAQEYYPDIYALKPIFETEPGWWKLRWRPLWRKTFSVHWFSWDRGFGAKIQWGYGFRTSGWHRSFDRIQGELVTPVGTLYFWVKYNYVVHRDGPSDLPEESKQCLELP